MLKKSLGVVLAIALVLQCMVVMPTQINAAEETYTYELQNEDFSSYGLSNGDEVNTTAIGWGYNGSAKDRTLTFKVEDNKNYIECVNNGGNPNKSDGGTFYFWRNLSDLIEGKVHIEFDARFTAGSTTFEFMSSAKPTSWPPRPITLVYDGDKQALMYGDAKVADLAAGEWSHITIFMDLEAGKTTIKASQNGQEQSLTDQALLDSSVPKFQSFVVLPKGPKGAVDITNVSMGHIQSQSAQKGIIRKFEYPESVAATEALIEEYDPELRQMESLNRGVVAVKQENGVFISWRWLATESSAVTYNVYRDGTKVNGLPIAGCTNFFDTNGQSDSTYTVVPALAGIEIGEESEPVSVWNEQYLSIPLQIPEGGTTRDGVSYTYSANDASVGDLDGDGEYEIVLKWDPSNSRDNMPGFTGPHIFQAYEMDGTPLWSINMGPNVIAGPHYTQFIVYDLDSDGKAEIAMRTSDGTIDGVGNVIGETGKDYWTEEGAILSGNEYLTIFEGETGEELASIPFEPARGAVSDWGDDYGNRVDRFLATVAYLDGDHPSLVMTRGYYAKTMMAAYDWDGYDLTNKWIFDTDEVGEAYTAQGNHQITAWDVDYDGKDEIVFGAMSVDHDGSPLYSTELGHGDALHVTDLDPSRPGYEIFQPHEHTDAEFGIEFRDARTGEILWGSFEGSDVGRGVAGDIDPYYYGSEAWGADKLLTCKGDLIKENPSIPQNFLIYWDGDLGREFLDQNRIDKWDPDQQKAKTIMIDREVSSNNSTKSTPVLAADLIGDWREEVIWRSKDSSELRLYTTTDMTEYRMYTLMQDPLYRMDIAWQNVGYNQPPHLSFYYGFDTTTIPVPAVYSMDGWFTNMNPDMFMTSEYQLEDLKRQEEIVLVVGENVGLHKGKAIMIDPENPEATPIKKGFKTLVPINFVKSVFNAKIEGTTEDQVSVSIGEMSFDLDLYKVDGASYISLYDLTSEMDLFYYYDNELIVISEDFQLIFSDERAALIEQVQHAVYEENQGDVLYQGPRLREDHLKVVAVDASTHDGNLPEGAVDSDFGTRWSSYGDGEWLMVDLGAKKYIKGVGGSYFKGDQRSYIFDIEVSTDKVSWTKVLTRASSSGKAAANEIEEFLFDDSIEARYVRYTGHGNSVNLYSNMWEFLVLEDQTELIIEEPKLQTTDGTDVGTIVANTSYNVLVPIKNNSDKEQSVPVNVKICHTSGASVTVEDTIQHVEKVPAKTSVVATVNVSLKSMDANDYIEIELPEASKEIKVIKNNVKFFTSSDVNYKFDFGNGDVEADYIGVEAKQAYDSTLGYGFNTPDQMTNVAASGSGAQSDAVRFDKSGLDSTNTFNVDLPNGLYEVKVVAGDIFRVSVAAEGVYQVINMTGNNAVDSFQIPITDGQLNLLITAGKTGTPFTLSSLEITKVSDSTQPQSTIYIGGDSTVCNYYPLENSVQAGWGQMLPAYINTDDYQVRNMASGGQCARGFKNDGQFEAIMKYLKEGDYFILQLGINDTNPKNDTTEVQFKQIMKEMVQAAKATGATVILSTPQGRATDFTDGVHSCPTRWYRAATVALAGEENVPLIDLNVLSSEYFTSIGAEKTLALYMDGDTLHPNREGSNQLARLVSEALKKLGFGEIVK